jgi:adenylate kinase
MKRFIIIGAQGSGKGTQARKLCAAYDLVHVSVGDILRWNIQSHTKLGSLVRRIVTSGKLVPDELIHDMIRARLDQHDWHFGFVLDGFPRTLGQAEFFRENFAFDAVIHVDIPDDEVIRRILSRRLCSQCGLDYNLIHSRPKQPDRCDVCGGNLTIRSDDTPEAVAVRLREYHEKTEPILELFRNGDLVVTVDGTLPPDDVQQEIRKQLRLPPR